MTSILANWRTTVFGLLSWLIPFLAAFPFFTPDGALAIPQPLFKSLMVVIGGVSGVLLLVWLFRYVRPALASGATIGIYWLLLNWLLDILILVPMSGDSIGGYFQDIGLRYLVLPAIAIGMGWVGGRRE